MYRSSSIFDAGTDTSLLIPINGQRMGVNYVDLENMEPTLLELAAYPKYSSNSRTSHFQGKKCFDESAKLIHFIYSNLEPAGYE